eukprot:347652-Pyramimonas_sp.AAC.1
MDGRTRLLRVLRARHRIPPLFTEGHLMFLWGQGRVGSGKWFGPGVIILQTAGRAWINVRGARW